MKFVESSPPFPLLGTKLNEHKAMTIGINMIESCFPDDGLLIKVDVCVKAEEEDRFYVELCDTNMRLQYVIILRSDLRYIKNC